MARKPENTGRKQGGAFAPGVSGNPAGKPRGARHKVTLAMEALFEGEAEALTRKAIDLALQGDGPALRLCLDRLAPARKDGPVSIALPAVITAADAVGASSAILSAVGAGDITPDEGGRIMALLTAHRAIVEVGDLERRIAELEGRNANEIRTRIEALEADAGKWGKAPIPIDVSGLTDEQRGVVRRAPWLPNGDLDVERMADADLRIMAQILAGAN